MGKPLRPLAIMVGGPMALAISLGTLLPLLDLPAPLDSWHKAMVAGAGIGLGMGVLFFFGIAWACSPRPPSGNLDDLRRKGRSLQRGLGLSLAFCLGYSFCCVLHGVKDGSFSFSSVWLLAGGFASCLLEMRLEHLSSIQAPVAHALGRPQE